MDFSTELRKTYLGAVPHTLYTALVWITAGVVGDQLSKSSSIIFFIVACSFIFPIGELIRRVMKASNFLSKENKLPQLFMLLAFTIPLSYPLIYLVCKSNINLFFPAFSILVGAHYLPFVYGYRMPSFSILCLLLVAEGIFIALAYPDSFSFAAYLTGGTLILFAIIHYYLIKKEIV